MGIRDRERPTDPALARLLPDTYRDDPEASAELRRLAEGDVRRAKNDASDAAARDAAGRRWQGAASTEATGGRLAAGAHRRPARPGQPARAWTRTRTCGEARLTATTRGHRRWRSTAGWASCRSGSSSPSAADRRADLPGAPPGADGNLARVLTLTSAVRDAIVAHARRDHPDEACGIVAGPAGSDRAERLVEMDNAERSPTFYRFDSGEQLRVWREMDDRDEVPVVIYHSHTATEAYPSRTDIGLAGEPDAHYVLVSTADPDERRRPLVPDRRRRGHRGAGSVVVTAASARNSPGPAAG